MKRIKEATDIRKQFGEKYFKELTGCNTYRLSGTFSGPLFNLLDHGFIANAACVWGDDLEGHEFAIVSRTYCDEETIDNPPDGLKCVRIPWAMGKDDPGTAIATVITKATPVANAVVNLCQDLPASLIPLLLSLGLTEDYAIALSYSNLRVTAKIIIKDEVR